MPCHPALSRFRRSAAVLGTLLGSASCATLGERIGKSSPYRTPGIVLAYPAPGTVLPSDRAVVVLRFAPRETDDPIDPRSFKATVDDVDRTVLFRVTDGDAWGTLADTTASGGGASPPMVPSGPHTLAARVCSVRGVCGTITAVVEVRPWDRTISPARTSRAALSLPNSTNNALTVSRVEAAQPRAAARPAGA